MNKSIAIYLRVSTASQTAESQIPELTRWAEQQNTPIAWYRDTFTGRTMDRPGIESMLTDMRAGKISQIVVWRLDRLGRTASGLCKLFDELIERKVNLASLKDGIDLSTSAGRLMANVIASVAQYETEVRAERVRAGQEVARAEGKRWGGGVKGRLLKKEVTHDRVREYVCRGLSPAETATILKVSLRTIKSRIRDLGGMAAIKRSAGATSAEARPEPSN